jgi:hypothetical protein
MAKKPNSSLTLPLGSTASAGATASRSPTDTIFPSHEDRKALLRAIEAAGWNLDRALCEEDRWRWHAYDYGWRRVQLGDDARAAPIDPGGVWFDEVLAGMAEQFHARRRPDQRPSNPDSVREDFERLHVRQWTRAELAIAVKRTDDAAAARGFGRGQHARLELVRAMLAERQAGARRMRRGTFGPPAAEMLRAKPAHLDGASKELLAMLGYDPAPAASSSGSSASSAP